MTIRQQYVKIYWSWKAIKQRTRNPKCRAYKNYGGRGIDVCKEWEEFEPFLAWSLANGWEKGLDIDRIDNDGNYEPSNCRYVSRADNVNNRRVTIFVTVDGVRKSASEWAKITGIPKGSIKVWYETKDESYVVDRIKEALQNGYHPEKRMRHTKVIYHESGMRFESVKAAAEYYGMNPCTISTCIRGNRSTRAGRFSFERSDQKEVQHAEG